MSLLNNVYPEYNWLPWRFMGTANNFWDSPQNKRNYMDWLFNHLNFTHLDDWYTISKEVFLQYSL